jgi:hypothetical protein
MEQRRFCWDVLQRLHARVRGRFGDAHTDRDEDQQAPANSDSDPDKHAYADANHDTDPDPDVDPSQHSDSNAHTAPDCHENAGKDAYANTYADGSVVVAGGIGLSLVG